MLYTVTCVCIFILTYVIFKCFAYFNGKQYPNGPWGLPVLGHLPFLKKNKIETFQKWRAKYGDVFRIRLGSWNAVVVNGFNAVKEAAEKENDAFSGRPNFVSQQVLKERNNGNDTLGWGQFNSMYLVHRKVTATALQTLTSSQKVSSYELINEELDALVDRFLSHGPDKLVSVESDLQFAIGSVIYQLLYGRGKDVREGKNLHDIVRSTNAFIRFTRSGNPWDVMPWLRYVMPWKISEFLFITKTLEDIKHEQIDEHKKLFNINAIKDITDSFLAVDLEDPSLKGITRDRLLNALTDLLRAGFETTYSTMKWMILYMAAYPEVQERVQKEIDDVIGYARRANVNNRANLPFTDATIQEIMRMTSIVPLALPHCTTTDTKLNGFDIDKGTVVLFNLHSVANDRKFWGDPEMFRPERLLTETNTLDQEKCSHILPFGLGRRHCAGMQLAKSEIFLFFATLMQRCKFLKPEGDELDLNPGPATLVQSPKKYRIYIRERHNMP